MGEKQIAYGRKTYKTVNQRARVSYETKLFLNNDIEERENGITQATYFSDCAQKMRLKEPHKK